MSRLFDRIKDGRTDLVFDFLAEGNPATATDSSGTGLLEWCAYYGDVSAIKYLLHHGANLSVLGADLGIIGASFHGHWRLCQFLLESGADAGYVMPETGETPLHSALCTPNRVRHNPVMKVLLAAGANPNAGTIPGIETGGFMRDCRTKGETPLHRAAAFGDEAAIRMLIEAGARLDAPDANGDSPLCWASWYARPTPVLRLLLYGGIRIHPESRSMDANLQGEPH